MLKTIASNTFAQLVAKFFGAGLTLLTTYYTIRLAGLDLYGDLTKILVLVAIGFTAIDFGLNAQGLRSASSPAQMRRNTQTILIARLFLSCLAILGLNIFIYLLGGGYSPALKSLFWVGSLAIIFQGIYTSANAWFQYTLSYWRSTLAVVVGSLFGTLLTFYYLSHSPTLFHLVLANTLGYLVMALCSLLLLPRLYISTTAKVSSIFPFLARASTLGFILLASVFASKIDTVMLGIFRPSGEVGQYGFAYRIFDVILVIPVFVMNSVYPLLLGSIARGQTRALIYLTSLTMLILGLIAATTLWFVAPAVLLVKSSLILSVPILRILAFSLPLFYLTAPLMWGLIAKHQDKLVLSIYAAAAFLNLCLNLAFIPRYGALAAAYNTGLTELIILISLLYFSRSL